MSLFVMDLVPGSRSKLLDDLDVLHPRDSPFELSRLYVDEAANIYTRLRELETNGAPKRG